MPENWLQQCRLSPVIGIFPSSAQAAEQSVRYMNRKAKARTASFNRRLQYHAQIPRSPGWQVRGMQIADKALLLEVGFTQKTGTPIQ